MSEDWWRTLLREQQGSGFADVAGAQGALTLPVSDRLVSALINAGMPPAGPLSSLQLLAESDQRFAVRIKLRAPAFLPAFTLKFAIIGQPDLPTSPALTCAVLAGSLGPFMGPLVKAFRTLPPWIALNQERVTVDLGGLARQYRASELFGLLTHLQLSTAPGRFVLTVQGALPERR